MVEKAAVNQKEKEGRDSGNKSWLTVHLFRTNLRRIFLSVFTFILVLTFLILAPAAAYLIRGMEHQAWEGRHNEAAGNASRTVENFIQQAGATTTILAYLGPRELQVNPGLIQSIIQQNPSILEAVRVDANGNILGSADQGDPVLRNAFTIRQSTWFNRAKSGQAYYSKLYTTANNEPYMIISQPSKDGGVAAIRLRMKILWDVISGIQFGQSGRAYLIDEDGIIIADRDAFIVLANTSIAGRPEYQAALAANNYEWVGEYTNFQHDTVIGHSTRVSGTDWILFTEMSQLEVFTASRTALILMGGLMLLIVILSNLLAERSLKKMVFIPMEKLRDGTRRISAGDLTYRIELDREDEIGEVATAFNLMCDSLTAQQETLINQARLLEKDVIERKRIEEELRAAHDLLEIRVQERTQALNFANEELAGEVIERRKVEANLRESEEQIRESLFEKEVLLKEIHHRVKNNMQVIISLLNISMKRIEDPAARRAILESQHRIRSMALIHEKLYRSHDLARIDFKDYIQSLTNFLCRSYPSESIDVKTNLDISEVYLTIEAAVPCGLIINELYSNALKHAFPNRKDGQINIRFSEVESGSYELEISDNGIGLPPDWTIYQSGSLGMQIVDALVSQLKGSLNFESQAGTRFTIRFPTG